MSRPRIIIFDDSPFVLKKVSELLEPEFEVVGTFSNVQTIVLEVAKLQPDVVILDIIMPGINGIEASRQLQQARSTAKKVICTQLEHPDFQSEALSTGALGYVFKARLASELIPAIHEALSNRSFVSSQLKTVSQG